VSNGDVPDVPSVTTPDITQLSRAGDSGHESSGIAGYYLKVFWAGLIEGMKIVLTVLADVFDELAALLTGFFTAAQGQDTPGFNDLVAAVLSDTLGVEVSGSDLSQAQFQSGRIGAMQKVGEDLFNTLANEFVGVGAVATSGSGLGGLPDTGGKPLTPEQGIKAAQAFIGFALSFAVRQGNVAFLSSALPWEWLSGIREYGEMMAKNLGLGRLTRRALQPFIQTLIATPLQEALNRQYRPKVLDAKQLASAFIRGEFDRTNYLDRLAGQGYTDQDAAILVNDTYTRMNLEEVLLLNDVGILSDDDLQPRVQALGFNSSDIPLLLRARRLTAIQGLDRKYSALLADRLVQGSISQEDYDIAINKLPLPKYEIDRTTRNAVELLILRQKQLSLSIVKKMYLNAVITIDELLTHVRELGYQPDDVDLIEMEVLTEQAQAAAKAKMKASKAGKKKGTTTGG